MESKRVFFLVLSVVLFGCFGAPAFAASSAPLSIPVGVVVSLTGVYSSLGNQAKVGYELGAEEINRKGGVFVKEYGKKIPIEVMAQDTESEPAKTISRMEWLQTKKVVAFVGDGVMVNGQGVAEKNKTPAIIVAAPHQSPHDRGLKYWFSTTPKSPDLARFSFDILDSIPADKRPKTIAILEETTDWVIEQSEAFRKEANQRGYRIALFEKYGRMTKDWSNLIMAVKNAGVEAIMSCPITPDAMAMMRQMKELDYNPKACFILRGAEDVTWPKAMGAIGDYVIRVGPQWHYTMKDPDTVRLNVIHQAKFGKHPEITTGASYATMCVLAAAIEKAGVLDPTKIREALLSVDTTTTLGRIKFNPNGTVVDPSPASIQWAKGEEKLVWPKEFRSNLIYPIPPWNERP